MYKLGPLLARAYIMQVNGELTARKFAQLMEEIKQSNFTLLDEAHHYLAGYKALFTDWTFQGIEDARISCGGAGFLAWSGFAELHDFYSP
jgi:acyl-CoA oxidase